MTMDGVVEAAEEAPRRWALAATIRLPDPDEMLGDSAFAALVGWGGGAKTVANRRTTGRSLPESVKIGKSHYFSGAAIRTWILSGKASEETVAQQCPVCGRRFASRRGLAVHQGHLGHRAASTS